MNGLFSVLIKINIIGLALHPTNGFFPGYSVFPIHPLGCLESEAFFLFRSRIQNKLLSPPFSSHKYVFQSSARSLSVSPSAPPPPAPLSPHLSLSPFCFISVLRHIIFITSHLLHVIVMQTIFQAPNKLQNSTKTR